jgi:methylenetetrahydrofolate dehydrogenase (NADP+) / methenyltetrahydrofolate cyclohydrolase
MTATVIDGKKIAAALRARLTKDVASLATKGVRTPGLAVVLVGDDPASAVYVRSKAKMCVEIGMRSIEHRLSEDTSETNLLTLISQLNADMAVDGILVQLPLPKDIDSHRVISAIDPDKDVDGFHPINVGRLSLGLPGFTPCTPAGCMKLLDSVRADLTGMSAVVIGRSNIVGKPMAQLLLARNCTVTIAHSRTADLPAVCRQADVLVAAVGIPKFVKAGWIKPGAIVLDVGINRLPPSSHGPGGLVGDVDYEEAVAVAGAITPVPGGVGPMTIACLLSNTLDSAVRRDACGFGGVRSSPP